MSLSTTTPGHKTLLGILKQALKRRLYDPKRISRSGAFFQTIDDENSDTVVVTSLEETPFCCHEDLLAMPRPALLDVARALNKKLPAALRIDINPNCSDRYIRTSIELIVGIRPPAPRPTRRIAHSEYEEAGSRASISPPTSPVEMRKRRPMSMGDYNASPRLASLMEEDEELDDHLPSKIATTHEAVNQDVFQAITSNQGLKRRRITSLSPDSPLRRSTMGLTLPFSPTPKPRGTARASSYHDTRPHILRPATRILRSQSLKLPKDLDTAFVTIRRPSYKAKRKQDKTAQSKDTNTSVSTMASDSTVGSNLSNKQEDMARPLKRTKHDTNEDVTADLADNMGGMSMVQSISDVELSVSG